MFNYNIFISSEKRKNEIIKAITDGGAKLKTIQARGPGYYIQLSATPSQVCAINKRIGGGA